MTSVRPTLPQLEQLGPARAAAFWLERLQHDEADRDDAVFRGWLDASDANRDAWDRALDLWDSFEAADQDKDIARMSCEARAERSRPSVPRWFGYVAAASVAIAAAALIVLNIGEFGGRASNPVEQPDNHHFGAPDYETRVGQLTTVTLSDGSRLTLDTDTAVDIAFSSDKRLVRLIRGQVFFDVAHDGDRPFRVAAGERIVSDLGTRFNIRVTDGETRILLVDGSVGVSRGADPARPAPEFNRLPPGQELVARPGSADQIGSVNVEMALQWRRGFVQFDDSTLAAAIAELNRYTDEKLIVRDPTVAALRVSGAFPTRDMDPFIQTLSALYPVRAVSLADGRREIVRRP